ncbi:MAG: hypothetical protein KDK56_02880 [Simkania sp.]|nr:hypothetical protein [Simkania sp.]MCB1074567.1 hypothetical protein [Simkania sp.]MCP5491224.1 hypothetical protein [Chlamydiales bacterium]
MNIKISEKIKNASVSLEKYGLNELAWTKENAINLINSILNDKIAILGGDVYLLASGNIEPLYDNWYCEKVSFETQNEYFLRSKLEALQYIKNYPVKNDEKIIFVIVFSDAIYG